ncbi:hypothetical protein Holit_03070 [Hollandina sp. SP2]
MVKILDFLVFSLNFFLQRLCLVFVNKSLFCIALSRFWAFHGEPNPYGSSETIEQTGRVKGTCFSHEWLYIGRQPLMVLWVRVHSPGFS